MTHVVCPGSFDPMHKGHLDVVERAAKLFDTVTVLVATNTNKKYLFSLDERVSLCKKYVGDLDNVTVDVLGNSLLADYCKEHDAALVKGVRNGSDFEYEVPMSTINAELSGVETVFLASAADVIHISSTIVKEVNYFGGDVSSMVNSATVQALESKR
ncbi:MAG: pantetheine-phosphate adenylyltransferase [Micrococcaceae bacterium]